MECARSAQRAWRAWSACSRCSGHGAHTAARAGMDRAQPAQQAWQARSVHSRRSKAIAWAERQDQPHSTPTQHAAALPSLQPQVRTCAAAWSWHRHDLSWPPIDGAATPNPCRLQTHRSPNGAPPYCPRPLPATPPSDPPMVRSPSGSTCRARSRASLLTMSCRSVLEKRRVSSEKKKYVHCIPAHREAKTTGLCGCTCSGMGRVQHSAQPLCTDTGLCALTTQEDLPPHA